MIRFIEQFLIVPDGRLVGTPVVLREWQKEIIRQIYDGHTRYFVLSLGRKNGKTSLIAMLLLAHLVGPEARANAQIFSAAQSRDQASIVFSLAAKMVRRSPILNDMVHVRESAKELFCGETGVKYKALSAEASTAYGLSPVLAIHDELGQVEGPRSDLYDALETAMGAQENPLSIVISTQSPSDGDLLSKLIDDAQTVDDPSTKLALYAAAADDDPWLEETWRKANPALGDFLNIEEVRRTAERARRMPALESSFRNLVLNQRVTGEAQFCPPAVWKRNGNAPDAEAFERCPVYAGLDLSTRNDLTAMVLIAVDGDVWHVRPYFWAPHEGIRDRSERDRVPYDIWAKSGELLTTPGASVDYEYIAEAHMGDVARMDLRAVAFDRWRIDEFKRALERAELTLPLIEFGQGYKSMTPAIELLESKLLEGKVRHGMHPVLNMCCHNTRMPKPDPAGNRKFDKGRSHARIDGMVALAMAAGSIALAEPVKPPSIYEREGVAYL